MHIAQGKCLDPVLTDVLSIYSIVNTIDATKISTNILLCKFISFNNVNMFEIFE